jgi:hypothetical protein
MDKTYRYWYYLTNMKAILKYSQKLILKNRYVIHLTIHEVSDSKKYPDGIKYGLICADTKSGRKVLLDNHHPKGPHIHLDDLELPYEFIDEDTLIDDFKKLVLEHLEIKI